MLYEPTQITPSTLTNTGTVAAADNVKIEWQVNGNSAMTAFQIDIYENNYNSTLVYSTGKVTAVSATSKTSKLPFYNKDRYGNAVTFTYAPSNTTWSDLGLVDGKSYKFQITQWCASSDNGVYVELTTALEEGYYYFSATVDGTLYYFYFYVSDAQYFVAGATIYYNVTSGIGYLYPATNRYLLWTIGITETEPSTDTYTLLDDTATALSSLDLATQQTSYAVINMRTTPTLTIDSFTTPVSKPVVDFTATYSQEQSDAIKWVRWLIAEVDDGEVDEENLLDDTGEVYTPVLAYSYTGFLDGNYYAVRCIIETENGVEVDTGWQSFYVSLSATISYDGALSVECSTSEDCNLLSWEALSTIPATTSGDYAVSDGQLTLDEGATITWSQKDEEDLSIATPWTAVWKGELSYLSPTTYSFSQATKIVSSDDGSVFASYYGKIVRVYTNGTSLSLFKTISLSQSVVDIALSSDGTTLCVAYANSTSSSTINIYTISSDDVELTNTVSLSGIVTAFAANSDCSLFAVGYYNQTDVSMGVNIISLTATLATISTGIYYPLLALSADGGSLAIYGSSTCTLYTISGSTVTTGATISGTIGWFKFTADGSKLFYSMQYSSSVYYMYAYDVSAATQFSISNSSRAITKADINSDGTLLVVYANSRTYFYSVDFDSSTATSLGNSSISGVICVSGDGKLIVICVSSSSLLTGYTWYLYSTETTDSTLFALNRTASGYSSISVRYVDGEIVLYRGSTAVSSVSMLINTASVIVELTPSRLEVYYYKSDGSSNSFNYTAVSYTQVVITSATLVGSQVCDYFAIVSGSTAFSTTKLNSLTWNTDSYTLELFASFTNGTDGGIGSSSGNSFVVTRIADNDETTLKTVANLPSTTSSMKDFGITSCTDYTYYLYVIASDGSYVGLLSESITGWQLQRCTLLAAEYDDDDEAYHVVKEYQFSANLTEEPTVSNNNSPSFSDNFTAYPTKHNTSSNYASGTLSGLIGYVDYTKNEYLNDTVSLQKELFALSTSDYEFFLKDMKGNIWQVALSSPIQQSWTIKTRQQQTTISIPWKEVADVSEATVIQVEEDSGWYKDTEALLVTFDVDIATGELSVTYPDNYSLKGTTFNLTDGEDETETDAVLVAETPTGTKSATFTISTVAEEADDGEIKGSTT